jgi:hypothetical protein
MCFAIPAEGRNPVKAVKAGFFQFVAESNKKQEFQADRQAEKKGLLSKKGRFDRPENFGRAVRGDQARTYVY